MTARERKWQRAAAILEKILTKQAERDLFWCNDCQAFVELESSLDATGLNERCSSCGSENILWEAK